MSTLAVGLAPPIDTGKRRVEVISYIRDGHAAAGPLAEKLADSLTRTAEVHELYLHPACVASEQEALAALAEDGPAAVILASPDFVVDRPDRGKQAAPLVERLRAASAEHGKPLALLALATPPQSGLSGIDAYLSLVPDAQDLASVGDKIFHRLSLKLPPRQRELDTDNAIRMQVATKRSEMLDAFRLRYKTYNALGYLPADDSADGGLDIDAYDKLSFQFIMVDHREGKVVGTYRLVMNRPSPHSSAHFDDRPAEVFARQRAMVDAIVEDCAGARIKRDYRADTPLVLPIFRSMDFSARWLSQFVPILGKCCEVSRVVLDPSYRGLKLLELMMRGAAVFAYDLAKSVVLLECAPHHIPMYEKYGYETIGLHGTCEELDQKAAGMRLDLAGTPHDANYQMARRLVDMILSQPAHCFDDDRTRHLCACALPNCWQNGSYAFRGSPHCPLLDWHDGEA